MCVCEAMYIRIVTEDLVGYVVESSCIYPTVCKKS